ncbi:hypothetical protein VZT92_008286 [Zoarces viviparus]|uniref:Uncharacterized protein n=1 Tax=Zoarces viviparus TaxID=48416 RepID=A0AAW1FE17_ZOAVI
MSAGHRKLRDGHFVFESAALGRVHQRGGSSRGAPLLIFPMMPRLTLRGLDSALLLARPGYSPASIALFDSPSRAPSCLGGSAAESLFSLGSSILNSPPTIRPAKKPSATG